MIKKILLGLGGTPYTTVAIERAIQLAKRLDAEVTGVTVANLNRIKRINVKGNDEQTSVLKRTMLTREQIEEAISLFESSCTNEGIRYRIKKEETEDSFNLMISLARYHDLMIFGLQSIFEYGISFEKPKDTLARLISSGVKPIIAVSDKFRPIQKALIAYDGSMESARTMKHFVQLRLWPNAKLKIVAFQRSEEKAHNILYDASEYCRSHGFHVEHESNPGIPRDLLLPMASLWQADIVVLGSSARSLLVRRAFGETALHVIRDSDKPLFLSQ